MEIKGSEKEEEEKGEEWKVRRRRRRAGAPGTKEKKEEERNIYSGSGWGLEVMSLQRDWATVEWSADFLVPDTGEGGGGGGGGLGDEGVEEACFSAAGGEDAFVFRAAAIAEASGPRGRGRGRDGVLYLVS